MYTSIKEEEKNNREQKKQARGDSYKSTSVIDEKEEKIDDNFNLDYFAQKNYEENKVNTSMNKRNLVFNLQNKKNLPVRLRYNNENNNVNFKNKQNFKKSVEIEESKNKIKQEYDKNEDDLTDRNKRYIFNSVDEKIMNGGESRISKETTTHASKGSMTSSSKDTNNTLSLLLPLFK